MKYSETIHFHAVALLVCSCSSLLAQAPLKPTLPAQKDPFLRERGATQTPPPAAAASVLSITNVVETYALKGEDALALISGAPDGPVRYRQVREWVKAGRARLETVMAAATRSNSRTLVESTDMVEVGNKYESGQNADDAPVATSSTQQQFGERLEFEPVIGPDGAMFNLNVSFETSQFLGHRGLKSGPRAQPWPSAQFEKRQIITSLTGSANTPTLLGTMSRPPALAADAKEKETVVAFGRIAINRDAPQAPAQWSRHAEHQFSFYSMERLAAQEILSGELKPGAVFGAVQALVGKQQAQFEHGTLMASQDGVRAKSDENVISVEPAGMTMGAVKPPTPTAMPVAPNLGGKNRGLSIEVLTSFEAPPTGGQTGPAAADVNAIIYWKGDRGIWKGKVGGPPLYPETTVEESRKIETYLSVYPGVQTLIGTLNPPRATGVNDRADSGRVWLAFLRVTPVKP